MSKKPTKAELTQEIQELRVERNDLQIKIQHYKSAHAFDTLEICRLVELAGKGQSKYILRELKKLWELRKAL